MSRHNRQNQQIAITQFVKLSNLLKLLIVNLLFVDALDTWRNRLGTACSKRINKLYVLEEMSDQMRQQIERHEREHLLVS